MTPVVQGDRLPIPETGPDEARRDAERILADFEWDVPDGDESWLQSLARTIGNVIESVVGALFGSGLLTFVAWALIAGAVVALVVLVLRRRRRPAKVAPTVRTTSLEASRSPDAWRSEAEELEARGEWKLGLRARYRALVSRLIHDRHLRDIPGRTTGEFRIELAASLPVAAHAFDRATDLFERAWYGDRPTGPAEAAEFEALADEVLGMVRA